MTTPEGKIVLALKKSVRDYGGQCRKCKWVSHNGAPDYFIMIGGHSLFIECKAPGEKPEEHQIREHQTMRKLGGCAVFVLDDARLIDDILRLVSHGVHPLKAAGLVAK